MTVGEIAGLRASHPICSLTGAGEAGKVGTCWDVLSLLSSLLFVAATAAAAATVLCGVWVVMYSIGLLCVPV